MDGLCPSPERIGSLAVKMAVGANFFVARHGNRPPFHAMCARMSLMATKAKQTDESATP
jgi:hypothetical protein